jgi:hypothetical protein
MSKKRNRKNNKTRPLRTVYNGIDITGFNPDDFNNEMALYNHFKTQSNDPSFSLLKLLSDNPLIQIIENKRLKFLKLWDSKRIPVGGGKKSDSQILGEFKQLRNKKWWKILSKDDKGQKNILKSGTNFGSGVNQYFPEMLDVPTTKDSIIESLRKPHDFLKAYEQKIFNDGFHQLKADKSNFYEVFIQMVRRGCGSHPVVNFPALVAQYIVMESYFTFINRNNGIENDNFVILDPAAGWSGRFLGVLCAFHKLRRHYQRKYGRQLHVTYLTTDPNKNVHERFSALFNDWFELIEPKNTIEYFHFRKEELGCETPEFLNYCEGVLSDLNVSGVNVALTSPPYFCQEQYSKDEAQSCVKYRDDYNGWVDNFLTGMIKNVHTLLQPTGRFYLNIANTTKNSKKHPLQSDSVRLMTEQGMREVITYKMLLMGNPNMNCENVVLVNGKRKKFEPIFVFEK